MLSYVCTMPNTMSAKKALRQNNKRKERNLFWKRRIDANMKKIRKSISKGEKNAEDLNAMQTALQKVLDKAAKNNVIHKNKANRLKSRYAKKLAAHLSQETKGTKSKSAK